MDGKTRYQIELLQNAPYGVSSKQIEEFRRVFREDPGNLEFYVILTYMDSEGIDGITRKSILDNGISVLLTVTIGPSNSKSHSGSEERRNYKDFLNYRKFLYLFLDPAMSSKGFPWEYSEQVLKRLT